MPPKSKWWAFFDKSKDNTVKCRTCGKVLKSSGNTSNLKSHVEAKHTALIGKNIGEKEQHAVIDVGNPDDPVDDPLPPPAKKIVIAQPAHTQSDDSPSTSTGKVAEPGMRTSVQPNLKQAFQSVAQFQAGGGKHSEITNTLAYMLAVDNLPFKSIEKKGLKKLLRVAAPQYRPPSRQTIKRVICSKYNSISQVYKNIFASLTSYSVTTDIWTDTMQARSFLGTTIHFLDDKEMKNCTLGVVQLDSNHTGEFIASKLISLFCEWGLQTENVHHVVTDSAANMMKAIQLGFGKNKHISCLAHIINLICQRALQIEGSTELIEKVKKIVTWFKHSVVACDELRCSSDLKLIQSVETRWNSTFFMIERFLIVSSQISSILLGHPSAPPMVTAAELEQLRDIQKLLQPLQTATNDMSGEQYVTSSLAIPIAKEIRDSIDIVAPKTSVGLSLKQALITQIEKRLAHCEHILNLSVATLLDPRFKNMYFKSPEVVAKTIREVKRLMKQATNTPSSQSQSDSSESDSGSPDRSSLFARHSKLVQASWKKSTPHSDSDIPDQLALYLRSPAECDVKRNPIHYWLDMAAAAPELSQVALKYLCSVATSVPAERLFSAAGGVLTQERNRLKGDMLSKLLFLQTVEEQLFF